MMYLVNNGIPFEYETNKITWVDNNLFEHTYIVDFKINNDFFEIKAGNKRSLNVIKDEEKYHNINKILLNKNKQLFIYSCNDIIKHFNGHIDIFNKSYFYQYLKDMVDNNEIIVTKKLTKTCKQPALLLNAGIDITKNNIILKYEE